MLQNGETAVGIFVDRVRHEQVATRTAVRASHTPAKLVELREAEGVGAVHEHCVGVGNVES